MWPHDYYHAGYFYPNYFLPVLPDRPSEGPLGGRLYPLTAHVGWKVRGSQGPEEDWSGGWDGRE